MDKAKPGDRAVFSGTLVVVPDIVQLMKPGEKFQSSTQDRDKMKRNDDFGRPMDGFAGLARTGVKDLSFKMVFIASSVFSSDARFSMQKMSGSSEEVEKEENLN